VRRWRYQTFLAAAAFVFVTANECAASQTLRILDPLSVTAEGDPAGAVIAVTIPAGLRARKCDVVVIGGGLGGSAAAMTAVRAGHHVCMTEPTYWLGGQMTSQGVSAFDENAWSETSGSNASYLVLRQKIREHYRPLLKEKPGSAFNPGNCWVSGLCFEPRVAVRALDEMLQPYEQSKMLSVYLRAVPVKAEKQGNAIKSVIFYSFSGKAFFRLEGKTFIDATELGEFLPLAGALYITGAESSAMTGEPDAPAAANPKALQSFTYPFILQTATAHKSERPSHYEENLKHFSLDSVENPELTLHYRFFEQGEKTPGSFWSYRRSVDASQFKPGAFASDLSMINWSSNDVCDAGLLADNPEETARAMQHGKQVALGFAWWIVREAPRDEGRGRGYGNLAVVKDAMGSEDGLSQFPYVRESRRMLALRTVREQDLAPKDASAARAVQFEDSVGIGYYAMDIHACDPQPSLPSSKPYQIPLAALMSQNIANLMAASKNIGTTHFTNGAYRLHPTEWAIGIAAGEAAHEALAAAVPLREIAQDPTRLRRLQLKLIGLGQPLVWYDDVPISSPEFRGVQAASILGLLPLRTGTLHFSPLQPVTAEELNFALNKLDPSGAFLLEPFGSAPVDWKQLARFGRGAEQRHGAVRRGDFAVWLYGMESRSLLHRDARTGDTALSKPYQ
jgi:hypothetical protein